MNSLSEIQITWLIAVVVIYLRSSGACIRLWTFYAPQLSPDELIEEQPSAQREKMTKEAILYIELVHLHDRDILRTMLLQP